MSGVLGWVASSGVVQGVIMGLTFAYLTAIVTLNAVAQRETTTVNGWRSIRRAGQPGLGVLARAALQKALPVVNVFEEAAYWTTVVDASGARLRGGQEYILHFPRGALPPNGGFWSLTATDPGGYVVAAPSGRPSVESHAGLSANADGSVDVRLMSHDPADAKGNWLRTPPGRYKLMFRVYLPGAAITHGEYALPPVKAAGT